MLADLTGRTALVTGGGQGLGLGIVERMAGQGANIIIADLNDENATAAAAKVEEMGCKGFAVHMDVTDQQSISEAVALAYDSAGRIDILANNAGVSGAPGSTGTEWRDVDWEFTWKVNVKGLSDVTEAILPSDARAAVRQDHQHLLGRGPRRPLRHGLLRDHEDGGDCLHSGFSQRICDGQYQRQRHRSR